MEWRGMLIIEKNQCTNWILKWNFSTSPPPNFIFKRVGMSRPGKYQWSKNQIMLSASAFVKMQTYADHVTVKSFGISTVARYPAISSGLSASPLHESARKKQDRDWGPGGSSSGPNDAAITKVKLWPGRVQNDQSDWEVFFILSLYIIYIYIYTHIYIY